MQDRLTSIIKMVFDHVAMAVHTKYRSFAHCTYVGIEVTCLAPVNSCDI